MPGRLREIAEEAQRGAKKEPYDYAAGTPDSGGSYSDSAKGVDSPSPAHEGPSPIGGLRGE